MSHIIISLDGSIGAGKSKMLESIREQIPEINIVAEPVDQWTYLANENGQNMLELFYEDKKRWGYTFQTCALLTRQKNMQAMINQLSGSQIILTERSILTDKHIFAEMLHRTGDLSLIEWDLYNMLFDTISQQQSVHAIIYLSTGSVTCRERIGIRGRPEEETISLNYLDELHKQHQTWMENPGVPVLTLSTEQDSSVDKNIQLIKEFIATLRQ
jgi:deoxyadenosine/deoxycytidine kinase